MKKLTCSLFSTPRIKLDGKLVNIKTRKGLALLAYLALTGWPVERELLASMLWPDFDNYRARANLRRTLFTLQQSPIAEWFDADQFTIGLTAEALKQIDLVQFDRLLAASGRDSLIRAISLYKGAFMEGFYLPDCDTFEEWLVEERERYQRQFLNALDRLTTNYLLSGEFDSAQYNARKQLEIDNFRESAWRQLMAALVASGRRAEALAEFGRCRRLLKEEFGVEPSPDTLDLLDSIQHINTRDMALVSAAF